jgi:4-hydroxymandelate oxidase
VLPRIAEVVRHRVPRLLDGGVRFGSDVALATAVGIGRPVVWGLAAGGERGVRHVLELLREEFDHALALRGIGEASWP